MPVPPTTRNQQAEPLPIRARRLRPLSAQPRAVARADRCPAPQRKKRAPNTPKSRLCRYRPRRRTSHSTPTLTLSIFLQSNALASLDSPPGWIRKSNRPMATALPTSLSRTVTAPRLHHRTRLLRPLHQAPRMLRPSRLPETSTSRLATTPRLSKSTQKVETLDSSFARAHADTLSL